MSHPSKRNAQQTGAMTILLGVGAILLPTIAGEAVGMLSAAVLVVVGIAEFWFAFRTRSLGVGWARLVFGGLSILAGAIMFARPLLGIASLTLVAGVYLILGGGARLVAGFERKPVEGWGWLLVDGVASTLFGCAMLWEWPATGAWALGICLGGALVVRGVTIVKLGYAPDPITATVEAARPGR